MAGMPFRQLEAVMRRGRNTRHANAGESTNSDAAGERTNIPSGCETRLHQSNNCPGWWRGA